LAAGADPNRQSRVEEEALPLCAAASHNRAEVIEALLAAGADPNRFEHDQYGETGPLHIAASLGHVEAAELVAGGADPNLRDGSGLTPRELAHRRAARRAITSYPTGTPAAGG
jgi:ankyrin repeat protein